MYTRVGVDFLVCVAFFSSVICTLGLDTVSLVCVAFFSSVICTLEWDTVSLVCVAFNIGYMYIRVGHSLWFVWPSILVICTLGWGTVSGFCGLLQ